MAKELKEVVKMIQYKTDLTLQQIAKEIGYHKDYFTDQVNKGGNDTILNKLRMKYANVLDNKTSELLAEKIEKGNRILDADKIKSLDAAISVLIAEVASLKAERSGEAVQQVIMRLQKSSSDVAKLL